ncbi:hypothetical protein [Sphingomonas sp. Leaf17]|uniref:hypothetical protein n=1 Tax=Sphingomonas sp. Leaf17 TaxID=1735683 RepID=UPI00138F6BFA|nr:hypothetical protein [Sphingomonas sp. Leaf17]
MNDTSLARNQPRKSRAALRARVDEDRRTAVTGRAPFTGNAAVGKPGEAAGH